MKFKDLEPSRTEVTIIKYEWPVGQMRQLAEMGMEQCLDQMAQALKGV